MQEVGSPEWFNEKAKELTDFNERVEGLRHAFLDRYSPEKLAKMNGTALLRDVFGDNDAMIQMLMFDSDYRGFGAAGKYKYLGIVYYSDGDGTWRYKEGNRAISISKEEAEAKAEYIRDKLLECISIIGRSELNAISDYDKLDDALSHIFFYKYPWVIKYFQMVYPQYFPGMYADVTLERALEILGLPDHGKSKRLVNCGEIALFIRRCNINNIVFGHIYGTYWGWESVQHACPSASRNYDERFIVPKEINLRFYKFA